MPVFSQAAVRSLSDSNGLSTPTIRSLTAGVHMKGDALGKCLCWCVKRTILLLLWSEKNKFTQRRVFPPPILPNSGNATAFKGMEEHLLSQQPGASSTPASQGAGLASSPLLLWYNISHSPCRNDYQTSGPKSRRLGHCMPYLKKLQGVGREAGMMRFPHSRLSRLLCCTTHFTLCVI